jgi:hypothetical protein
MKIFNFPAKPSTAQILEKIPEAKDKDITLLELDDGSYCIIFFDEPIEDAK